MADDVSSWVCTEMLIADKRRIQMSNHGKLENGIHCVLAIITGSLFVLCPGKHTGY